MKYVSSLSHSILFAIVIIAQVSIAGLPMGKQTDPDGVEDIQTGTPQISKQPNFFMPPILAALSTCIALVLVATSFYD